MDEEGPPGEQAGCLGLQGFFQGQGGCSCLGRENCSCCIPLCRSLPSRRTWDAAAWIEAPNPPTTHRGPRHTHIPPGAPAAASTHRAHLTFPSRARDSSVRQRLSSTETAPRASVPRLPGAQPRRGLWAAQEQCSDRRRQERLEGTELGLQSSGARLALLSRLCPALCFGQWLNLVRS